MAHYIASGGNRHPAIADWHLDTLAYGTDRNIAIWHPQDKTKGVQHLLVGHTDTVNAIRFLKIASRLYLISGSVDTTIRLWSPNRSSDGEPRTFECVQVLKEHSHSINCIATCMETAVFVTGSADASIKIWKVSPEKSEVAQLVQTIALKPRYFPLAISVSVLDRATESLILAVGGTSSSIQLFVVDLPSQEETRFRLIATLSGHEGWIRSLAFTNENSSQGSDILLASASQDKYIRLWRIHQGKELPAAAAAAGSDPALGAFLPGKSLSNKAHRFTAAQKDYSATFEALLLGHEDWIYSAAWSLKDNDLHLLTASADNSLAVWHQDSASGIWVTVARLGEISSEKGSTTATGSTGGFWTGLWSPNGKTVVSLGRTGSWRLWNFDSEQERWIQGNGVSGHTRAVSGICWSRNGDYLLSTSADQTTRLHAQMKFENQQSWHEMCRPQIHGYDLNCIDSLGDSSFVSGADEKLLRVFREPKAVADLLQHLCGIWGTNIENMPDAANMPVLGLSNKAIEAMEDGQEPDTGNTTDREAPDPASIIHKSTLSMDHPPFEDHLSRYTLWPEIEKLYGHGYEISTLAASHDGSIIATACKASSIDHAVIRLFETKTWSEVKPPLVAHSLTVTSLRFSSDDKYLLSVGRDRQWALFERSGDNDEAKIIYALKHSNSKGHTRMILDAAWAPGPKIAFATAGRDKLVKIWTHSSENGEGFASVNTISEESSVTAIDIMDTVCDSSFTFLAVGTETGKVTVYRLDLTNFSVNTTYPVDQKISPAKAISQLAWSPSRKAENTQADDEKLAIASEDCSLRIFSLESLIKPASL